MQFAFAGNFNFRTFHFRLKQWGKLNNRPKKKNKQSAKKNNKQSTKKKINK